MPSIKRSTILAVIVSLVMLTGVLTMPVAVLADYGFSSLYWGSRGEDVLNLQRDLTGLGFNTYGVDGVFGVKTYNAVTAFQEANQIPATGTVGTITKSKLESLTGQIHTVQIGDTLYKIALRYGTSVTALKKGNGIYTDIIYPGMKLTVADNSNSGMGYNASSKVELADWWKIVDQVFARGDVATVTDVSTGITFRVIRSGGTNHADCQPLTAADTAKMKQAYGRSWSWNRRAIIVSIDGHRFAASQNGMPHGNQTIYNNNFPGHFCMHFLNSRTHETNWVDTAHQAAVSQAARYQ